jgi:hypothetical protein
MLDIGFLPERPGKQNRCRRPTVWPDLGSRCSVPTGYGVPGRLNAAGWNRPCRLLKVDLIPLASNARRSC